MASRVDPNDALRPTQLIDYIGQDHIKEPLAAAIFSAKHRKKPLAHVLLSGPPGLGKTTLAQLIAREMEWSLFDVIGSTAGNPTSLAKTFIHMQPKTMFFIDEVHALRKPVQEVLYPVLEDGRLLYRARGGSGEFELHPVTVIGATTDLGKLAQPFIDRFQLPLSLMFYEIDELEEIARRSAAKLDMVLEPAALEAIAMRSRGTPRHTNTLLKWIRDFMLFHGEDNHIEAAYVQEVLWKKLRIDQEGLRPLDRAYLRVLNEAGGFLGLEAIASRLRQAAVTLENTVEPYLMYRLYIERMKGGRIITDLGQAHLASLKKRRINGKAA